MFAFDPARLQFIEEGHRYTWDGAPVPYSATGVLKACGMYAGLRFVSDADRDSGTRIHDVVELALKYADFGGACAAMNPTVEESEKARAWLDCIRDAGISVDPAHVEVSVYSAALNVAGRIDFIGTRGSEIFIGDGKSGSVQAATALQLALYASCCKSPRSIRRIAISLTGGRYHVHEFLRSEYQRDFADFAACVRVLETRRRFGI